METFEKSIWVCPYCFQQFSGTGDHSGWEELRNHLEINKSRIGRLLEELKSALSSSRCLANNINLSTHVNTELDDIQTHSVDCSAKAIEKGHELTCPDEGCKDRKPFSKKTNLLRHYRNHVSCNATCICRASHSNVDEYVRHTKACEAMQGAHLKGSKTTQAQWRVVEMRDDLLEKARQQLESQLAVTAKLPCPSPQIDLSFDRKKDVATSRTPQQLTTLELSKVANRRLETNTAQLECPPTDLQPPRNKRPRRYSMALSYPSISSVSEIEARIRLPSASEIEVPENHANRMPRPSRNAIGQNNQQCDGLFESDTLNLQEQQGVLNMPYHTIGASIPSCTPSTLVGSQMTGADPSTFFYHQQAYSKSSLHLNALPNPWVGHGSINEVSEYHADEYFGPTM